VTTFIETPSFPLTIAFGSAGGPQYKTVIVIAGGGAESRNLKWTYPLHAYDAACGVKTLADMEDLIAFFHVTAGRGLGFRFKDFADFKSCAQADTPAATDQTIGTGDDAETDFQLVKVYAHGAYSRSRNITKPVTGSVLISIDDVAQGSGWSVDTTTGIVTFDTAPATDEVIKAGYEFDVPCRFDTDTLSSVWEEYELLSASVPIIEVRL